MKPGLTAGHSAELIWIVDPSMTITLGGDARATVFSTPNMILLMERAAREALRPYLADGEESVGTEVNIEHTGPAGLGDTVRGTARVTMVDGRRVRFDVQAWCGRREIGRGQHSRAVVPVDRLIENLGKVSGDGGQVMNLLPQTGPLPAMQTIRVEVADRVATVILDRPGVLNAVNLQMTSDFEQVVAWLAGHPAEVRVVLLTGAGDAFCAGDDVKELPNLSTEQARQLSLRQANMYLALERLPQPVISLVNGVAFGGGCVAAYSTDLRLAAFNARFAMPEIRLGWPPGYGIAQLTALVGKSRALEMCLMGEPISAQQALEWGLVNEVVPAGMLIRRGRQIAERMLAMPAEALRRTKLLIHQDEGSLPKVTHRADTEAYIRCLELPDAQEGISAFVQKRTAKFTGH